MRWRPAGYCDHCTMPLLACTWLQGCHVCCCAVLLLRLVQRQHAAARGFSRMHLNRSSFLRSESYTGVSAM